MICFNKGCPYYREDEHCPAREGCAGYTDEVDILRAENEYLRMRLAEIRDRVNSMELPHEYHILYNRGWRDAIEEVRRYME